MLADVVRFALPDAYRPLSSSRSPQLTNGHGRGGEREQEWVKGMPLGDVFIRSMEKAWKAQDERERITLSPKSVLYPAVVPALPH